MKGLEPLWYEISPYLFFVLGMAAITHATPMATAFGALLLVMALLIIKMRWSYRSVGQYGKAQAARRAVRRVPAVDQRSRYRPDVRNHPMQRVRSR